MNEAPELPADLELVRLERAAGAREEAVRRAREGADEGTLVWVLAPERPGARNGRAWLTPEPAGLHAALVLRPGLPAADCAQLAPVAAVAIARALGAIVAPMTELHYRWPNDVLLDGGKVAGIWLDAAGSGDRIDWLVVSWAINTHDAPESLGFDAAAVQREGAAEPFEVGQLLQAIARELVAAIATWDEAGFEPVLRSWRGRMKLGEAVHFDTAGGEHLAGVAEAVADDGSISVRTHAGTQCLGLERFFGLPGGAGE